MDASEHSPDMHYKILILNPRKGDSLEGWTRAKHEVWQRLEEALLIGFLSFALASLPLRADEARLLRFPTIHSGRIVFTHAGDLFTVPASGGIARRLTSGDGYEMFARFSPDGRQLAFTGQYDGNTEVYIMPADGGVPKRLTYTATLDRDDVSDRMGPNNIVMTWRDNETVVYRSRRTQWNPFKGHLLLARTTGGMPEELPLPRGGWCSYSPDGRKLAYNRVFREFRTWKRYRGGQADEIWIYDFEAKTTEKIASDPAQDIFPMWRDDRIYFVSERDENHKANLFVYDLKSKQTRPLTRFTEFDVKFPSLGDSAIVFEMGGYIFQFDLATEQASQVPIEIREDFASGRGGLRDVSKEVTSFDVAPDGSRAVFGARGDVFTVPAKQGPTRNLTRSPGIHERNAVWSPDGRWIAYVADTTGEDEIYIRLQDGSGEPTRLTDGADTYKYQLRWSPDSKRILWSDKKNRLQFIEITSRQITLVARSNDWEIVDFTWAPDSQWIAFLQPEPRRFGRIQLYSLVSKETTPVTDGWSTVGSPAFSSDGKLLFFVSARTFNPTYSQTEWNHSYGDMQNLYFVTLEHDTRSPIAPKSDEVKLKDEQNPGTNTAAGGISPSISTTNTPGANKTNEVRVPVRVDAQGLIDRIASLPTPAGGYSDITSVGDKLYYLRKGKLWLFELEKQKETELGEFGGYVVSADQKKILVSGGGGHSIVDLPTGKIDVSSPMNLGDVKVQLDRAAEWSQIFQECWRQMRDFFYDPNLHRVDWAAIRQRYEPFLAHVHHRTDLTFLIGEMIGELNAGHAYVGGGDYPKPARINLGLLGARLERDPATGFVRINEILRGHNWDKTYRSPLTDIGVNVRPGDYILAVNGQPVNRTNDFYALMIDKAQKQVRLKVNSNPSETGAREQTVIPTDNEQPLYYLKWVLKNIETVEKASDGRIGYVHVPDMGVHGLNEFAKFYYPQLHKEALVLDCRGNGGGNVSPMIIERLRREPSMWTIARNGSVHVDPSGQMLGPKVLLLDQFSASDGDIVAYRFKAHKLGPVIGQRSWGGVVGIRGTLPLLDGGFLNRPEFSRFSLDGHEWIMEGHGVDPDIEVDNDPTREYGGIDDQLVRAIDELKTALSRNPVQIPPPPAYPDKRK